jgi:glutamine synthetase
MEINARLAELVRGIEAGRIDLGILAGIDMQGRLKGKLFDAAFFLGIVEDRHSAEMCSYVWATDMEMRPVDGYSLASWGSGYGDVRLRPDLDTIRPLSWQPRTAIALADPLDHDGLPLPVAPRVLLRRQLDLLAARGLHVKAGIETEFTLYQGTVGQLAAGNYRDLRPVTWDNRDYALDHPRQLSEFLRRLHKALVAAGLPPEALKTEAAIGQVELTFPYGDALEACDQHVLGKHAVRTIADRCGMSATFMAVPAAGVGNGLHVHVSLHGTEPLMADQTDPRQLSTLAQQMVAGLLAALPELAPLYAPTANSFRRYQKGSFAPTAFVWGRDNRTCAIRVVGHGRGLHLEVRLPGADANPYLVVAAIAAAARHGIDKKLTPPAPCDGNGYQALAQRMPTTLAQAAGTFGASDLALDLLGPEVHAHYAHAAHIELDAQRRTERWRRVSRRRRVPTAELRSRFSQT